MAWKQEQRAFQLAWLATWDLTSSSVWGLKVGWLGVALAGSFTEDSPMRRMRGIISSITTLGENEDIKIFARFGGSEGRRDGGDWILFHCWLRLLRGKRKERHDPKFTLPPSPIMTSLGKSLFQPQQQRHLRHHHYGYEATNKSRIGGSIVGFRICVHLDRWAQCLLCSTFPSRSHNTSDSERSIDHYLPEREGRREENIQCG